MNMQKFLKHAFNGRHPAASTGEKACCTLAKALAEVGDDLMILDSGTIGGFYEIALLMAGPFRTETYKERAYALLEPFKNCNKRKDKN